MGLERGKEEGEREETDEMFTPRLSFQYACD